LKIKKQEGKYFSNLSAKEKNLQIEKRKKKMRRKNMVELRSVARLTRCGGQSDKKLKRTIKIYV